MTEDETEDIKGAVKEAVKEAVDEQLPETLGESLTPMIRHTVKEVLRPFRRRTVAGYLLLVVAVILLYDANRNRADDIQGQRREACEDVNRRHDNTVKALDAALAKRLEKASPGLTAALEERRGATILLIDALAPKRDCNKLVSDE
jgi:hypothetical protein